MQLQRVAVVTTGVTCILVGAFASLVEATAPSDRATDAQHERPPSLRVATTARLADGGWAVVWDVTVTCPPGRQITGRALVAERDPRSIPELAGEDQGITAVRELDGTQRCTGHPQRLRLRLHVTDTVVTDPLSGVTRTYHEPIRPTPSSRTSAAVQLYSPESPDEGGFFVQYCAAPNCAEETGPRITIR